MDLSANSIASFYKSNVSGSDIEKFLGAQAQQYITNKIIPQPKTPTASSSYVQSPQVVQVQGSPMSASGISKNTWIYIGIGSAVAIVALIVIIKK